MSFYNPFMKGPDFGAGLSDIAGQVMQMMMMKKMFSQPGQTQVGQTEVPDQGPMAQVAKLQQAQGLMGGATQGANAMMGQNQNLMNDPNVSDIIKRILQGLPGVMGQGGM